MQETERIYDPICVACINLIRQFSPVELSNITKNWPDDQKDFISKARGIPLEERCDRAWAIYLKLDSIQDKNKKEKMRWKVMMLNQTDDILDDILFSFE